MKKVTYMSKLEVAQEHVDKACDALRDMGADGRSVRYELNLAAHRMSALWDAARELPAGTEIDV